MKRLVFSFGILTVGLCVASPALADFAVIRFNSGRLHHHQFDRFHTREPAEKALHWAVSRHVCRTA